MNPATEDILAAHIKTTQPFRSTGVVVSRRYNATRCNVIQVGPFITHLIEVHRASRKYGAFQCAAVIQLNHTDAVLPPAQ